MNKLKLAVASAALIVGGLSGFAFAKGHGDGGFRPDRKAMIEKFDLDKDGKLDDAEKAKAKAARAAMHTRRKAAALAKFDTNKDGTIDDSERLVMRTERADKRFAMLDTNKDGVISRDEFEAARGGKRGHGHRGHGKTK